MRTIFVVCCLVAGVVVSFGGPFYSLLFYLWIAYFRPDAWLNSDWFSPLGISQFVGVATVALTVVYAAKARWRRDAGVVLLLATLVHTYWSATHSIDFAWSWPWWTDFAKVLTISLLLVVHTTDTRRLRLVLAVIGLSLGVEQAKQGWFQFFFIPGSRNINEHLMLGDNNGIALGMFMLAPLLAALATTATRRWERWMYQVVVAGVIIRGIATYSRGGFLAAGTLALVYIARSKKRGRVLLATAAVAAVALSAMPPEFWDRMATISAPAERRDDSSASRLYFWSLATRMAVDHPYQGIGFNAYQVAYDQYDELGRYGSGRAVHSAWFGMLAETGIPGFALFICQLLISLRYCGVARRTFRTWACAPGEAYATSISNALTVFVVGGTFINAHYSEMAWHLFALSIAVKHIALEGATARAASLEPFQASVEAPLGR